MNPHPPHFARRLLRWVLRRDPAREAILGDLREEWAERLRRHGPARAGAWYARESLTLAGSTLLRALLHTTLNAMDFMGSGSPRSLLQDAAYALRALRRSPGFALLTAVIVGVGIGATTAAYSVVKPLLLAPLPFQEPEELVWIENEADPGQNSLSAVTSRSGNLQDFRERVRSMEGITGYNAFSDQAVYTLTGAGEPEQLRGFDVAQDFLEVLGVPPALGRNFTVEEGLWGGPRAVILTHGFWTRRFAADPAVVGTSLTLNGEPVEVVGVLPASFDFASFFKPGARVDFLQPFPVSPETNNWGNTMFFVGRLRDGATPATVQQELDAVLAALREEQPDRWGLGARVSPLQEHLAAPFRSSLLLLVAAAGTVLLIVCVNVSNMLLARTPGRAREVAVRKAMGASRTRLVRQLLLETVGISLVGSVLGAGIAFLATRFVSRAAGVQVPLLDSVQVDAGALMLGAVLALITGLVVGLVPALQVAEGGEAAVLRSTGRGHSGGRGARRLREVLVVAEVALACTLLVAGGLLLRSFQAVMETELGFEPARTMAWQLNPGRDFETVAEASTFYSQVADRVREIPGVQGVGLNDALPLGRNRTWGFIPVGTGEEEPQGHGFFPHMVDPGYLDAMEIRLLEGRNLAPYDTEESRAVVLMNRTGAEEVFQGSALGQRIRTGAAGGSEWEVVGVVEDVHHLSPELDPGIQVYFPIAQMWAYGTLDMVVRSTLPASQLRTAVAAALNELDPTMPTREVWTLEEALEGTVSARRFILRVLTAFGAVALLLAGLGIYGVLAYSVAERTPEIGIRMALGASVPTVVRGVLGKTVALAVVGIALGAGVSVWVAVLLRSLLFGVTTTDPATFAGMTLVLLAVAVAAGGIPAHRAARLNGVRALRAE